MSLLRLPGFWRDERGVAAIEMAFVAPVIAVVAVMSFSIWQQASRQREMAAALNAGVEYYMGGGTTDTQAHDVAMSAWTNAPGNGQVSAARSCRCGVAAMICTSTCADGTPPAIYVQLTATGTFQNMTNTAGRTATRVLRVQ